jgi:hypothetical protein
MVASHVSRISARAELRCAIIEDGTRHAGVGEDVMFRRRRNRQVEELAREPARETNPNAAIPHVRVLGLFEPAPSESVAEAALGEPERPPDDLRPPPFHIRAVPIDESLGGE